jgi:hypothetical protein
MAELDVEIRERVWRYVAGDTTLEAFREWFSAIAWDIDRRADTRTCDTVHEIDLFLAEFDHGDWSEAELKERIAPLVAGAVVELSASGWVQHSTTAGAGASNQTKHFGMVVEVVRPRIESSCAR